MAKEKKTEDAKGGDYNREGGTGANRRREILRSRRNMSDSGGWMYIIYRGGQQKKSKKEKATEVHSDGDRVEARWKLFRLKKRESLSLWN